MFRLEPINKPGESYHLLTVGGAVLGDVYREIDGYYAFWPEEHRRVCWSAWSLRWIADKLDELNKGWDEEVRRGLDEANTRLASMPHPGTFTKTDKSP